MVLRPIHLVLLAVGELVDAVSLALALHILALVDVTVAEGSCPRPVRLALEQFALILGTIGKGVCANSDALCIGIIDNQELTIDNYG